MSKRVSGPHFCAGTAKKIADKLYNELLAECDAHGGFLSYDDIRAIAEGFRSDLPASFPFYEDAYLDCMATAGGAGRRLLIRKTLPGFVVFAFTNDVIRAAFSSQYARMGKNWSVHFCDALADYADAVLVLPLSRNICKVYIEQACSHGEHLTIDDIVTSRPVAQLMGGLFEALVIATRNGRDVERFCDKINEHIRHVLTIGGPDPLLVNNRTCREFVAMLQDTNHQNRYRHTAYNREEMILRAN